MKAIVVLAAIVLVAASSARGQTLIDTSAAAAMGSGVGAAGTSAANLPQIRGNLTRNLSSGDAGWKEAGPSGGGNGKNAWQAGCHGSGGRQEAKSWATARAGGGNGGGWVTNNGGAKARR